MRKNYIVSMILFSLFVLGFSTQQVLAGTVPFDPVTLRDQMDEASALNYVQYAEVISGGSKVENKYVKTDDVLIHFNRSSDGTDIVAEVWDGNNWSSSVVVAADKVASDYQFSEQHFFALQDGTVVWLYDDLIISYDTASGFMSYTNPVPTSKAVPMPNGVVFVYYLAIVDDSSDEESAMTVRTWEPDSEVSAAVTLGSRNDQVALAVQASNNVLIDFITGVAYDLTNNYAILDSVEGSTTLGQDDIEVYVTVRNSGGDQVLATNTALLGYDYSDQQWVQTVTFDDMYVRQLYTTEDQQQIVAMVSNADYSVYSLYTWSSDDGWLVTQYTFASETTLLAPSINKKIDQFYYAFWEDSSNNLTVYTVAANNVVEQLTDRTLICNQKCSFTMDISSKGKVFVHWAKAHKLFAAAWTSKKNIWETKELVKYAKTVHITETQVADNGNWYVNYLRNDNHYIVRWTSDQGWNKEQSVVSEKEFFYNSEYYITHLNTDTADLIVEKLTSSGKTVVDTISEMSEYNTEKSFIFSNQLFISTETTDDDTVLNVVQL